MVLSKKEVGYLGYQKSKEHLAVQIIKSKTEALEKFNSLQLSCKECKKPISYKQRRNNFCNHTCAAIFTNKKRGRKYFCAKCSISLNKNHKYCDFCKSSFEFIKTDKVRKLFLIKERGRKCEVCNNDEWMGKPIPIELDHINGNSDDNLKSNLRLICPNCHAQTPTYKIKNIGKGSVRQIKRTLKLREKINATVAE